MRRTEEALAFLDFELVLQLLDLCRQAIVFFDQPRVVRGNLVDDLLKPPDLALQLLVLLAEQLLSLLLLLPARVELVLIAAALLA